LTTYWRIDWMVPAHKAIGGKAYWTALVDACRITSRKEAERLYELAGGANDSSLRLANARR
jgi:hypothetical protein